MSVVGVIIGIVVVLAVLGILIDKIQGSPKRAERMEMQTAFYKAQLEMLEKEEAAKQRHYDEIARKALEAQDKKG